jgi:membrane-associated phospholipid phosphatase
MVVIGTFLVIGGYQLYFWTKGIIKKENRKPYIIDTPLDDYIPYVPEFSYLYSFIYYPFFALPLLAINSYRDFAKLAVGGLALMSTMSIIWYFFPNRVPDHYRNNHNGGHNSEKFLKFVQYYDTNENNAFPSAHCAFAMYLAILSMKIANPLITWLFPLIIAVSCVFTKQHSIIDTFSGLLLGGVYGYLFS